MIAKTAEGLIGANNAMNVLQTPMKVFKEARAKGDTETMKRAMGYVEKSNEEAWRKKASADEGLKQEAEENKIKAEEQRKELEQRIKDNSKELEERIKNSDKENEDSAVLCGKISECSDEEVKSVTQTDIKEIETYKTEKTETVQPVTYTKTGEVKVVSTNVDFSIDV